MFCRFWLRNVLRAMTACNFSCFIRSDGSAPAALARLLFESPESQIIGKTPWFAAFLFFRAPASFFFWLFLFSDLVSSSLLFSSLTLPTSAFSSVHIVESLTSKPPSMNSCCYSIFQPCDSFSEFEWPKALFSCRRRWEGRMCVCVGVSLCKHHGCHSCWPTWETCPAWHAQ